MRGIWYNIRMFSQTYQRWAMALLAALCPIVVAAAPVSSELAGRAAAAWAARGRTLGSRLGSTVDRVSTHLTTNGTAFYSVRMSEGGSVILSSNTEMPPVIGFTAEPLEAEALDPAGPLWALLNRDLSSRGERLRAAAGRLTTSSAAGPTAEEREWAALLAEAAATNPPPLTTSAAAIRSESGVSDLRVPALVKSKWSQTNLNNGNACWNYYTPNGTDTSKFVPGASGNEYCGCVATAMSQVMRYHRHPTASIAQITRACAWGVSKGDNQTINLTTQGGTYDWDSMTLDPNHTSSVSEANRKAIGKLTSDAGISVYMKYHMDGTSGSGAFMFDICYSLTKVWGYKNAILFDSADIEQTDGSAERLEGFRKSLFANFDAGYPVCMGIPGHAIVADGYGFGVSGTTTNDYVHLNMGWAGSCDFWYNLPHMIEANSAFTSVDDIIYNIFPANDSGYAIVSGRLTNQAGAPMAGVTVQVWSGSALKGEAVSSEYGVWGVVVPEGTYTITAQTADGRLHGSRGNVSVKKPTTTSTNYNSTGRYVPRVYQVEKLGNSWGNDIVLSDDALPTRLTVTGAGMVPLKGTATYVATVTCSDGSTRTVTPTWSISGHTDSFLGYVYRTYATLSDQGVLTAGSNTRSGITVTATHTEGGVTLSASRSVSIVESKSLTKVAVPSASSLVYNGAEQGLSTSSAYTLSGVYRAKNAGSYQATALPNDGYRWSDGTVDAKTVNWSIARKALTVTAADLTVVAGEECPTFTATYSGFVGGEGPADLDGVLEFSCAYEPYYGVAGTTYSITPVGVESDNYDITFVPGRLTVLSPPPGTMLLLAFGNSSFKSER